MWLLCHSPNPPITIAGIERQSLEDLVEEMYRALDIDEMSIEEVLLRVRRYNELMGDVTPSKELAVKEWKGRNGLVLGMGGQQDLHERLCREIDGIGDCMFGT